MHRNVTLAALLLISLAPAFAQTRTESYSVFEADFQTTGTYANPYTEVRADAVFTRPDGSAWRIPLFWDGGSAWKVRISPDSLGDWSFRVSSNDAGLNGRTGSFVCAESARPGGIVASRRWPGHFERQNGAPFWFMGDTAWAYFTDVPEEKHFRAQAEAHAKARASQGFNVIHAMLLSEGGDGNNKGMPWKSIADEQINPGYFQEAEDRIRFANAQGLTVAIAIAWGDKQRKEPFAWRRIPGLEARRRYARYVAARFSAFDVYFLLSGEWHAEIRTRDNATNRQVFGEFVDIGNEFDAAEPHGRMIGIHPMTAYGSVREFASAPWMSFADYQQNYARLHARALMSRFSRGPVVNSEYGYFLRDQDGDGKPDKDNSYSADDMRHASWDIVMAGAYLVTGFGTTYFGGRRDPGAFDLNAARNTVWAEQMGNIAKLFRQLEWWQFAPADDLISTSAGPRGEDVRTPSASGRQKMELRPPKMTYWAMAAPGRAVLAYMRGISGAPVRIELGARGGEWQVRTYNPRTGEFGAARKVEIKDAHNFTPPDANDWVVLLQAHE